MISEWLIAFQTLLVIIAIFRGNFGRAMLTLVIGLGIAVVVGFTLPFDTAIRISFLIDYMVIAVLLVLVFVGRPKRVRY